AEDDEVDARIADLITGLADQGPHQRRLAAPSEPPPGLGCSVVVSGRMSLRARIGSTMSCRHTVEAAMSDPEAVDIMAARAAARTNPPRSGDIAASTTATNTSS